MRCIATLALTGCAALGGCATPGDATFDTPEEAVRRLVAASEDSDAADELLGPGGFELLRSGDEVADRQDLEAVVALVEESLDFENVGPDRKIALLGHDRWELPIPLVREATGWHFDVEAGREEILNRRVGRNELSTIATLRALVEAQREYAATGRDGETPQYAQRLVSREGHRDGLYWPVAEGEEPSPLGPLVAQAFEEGYRGDESGPIPYHGYCFRLLTEQGPSAPGGALGYLDDAGRLTRGFAVVAWPATYDNSGVMTFLVNQQGIVFERDLGPRDDSPVRVYDPDLSWTPTQD